MDTVWLRTLAADEAVYRAGDPGDAMFVVASGRIVARLSSPDGAAVDLSVASGGTLFGYLELLGGGRRSTDAVALGASRVVVLGAALATRLFETSPTLVRSLAREMAETVRAHTHAAREQAFFPVPARLARFLLGVADAEGRVLLDGPQLLLAQRLGVARQTLSRALHRLAASDLVRIDPSGRAITIIDEPGLRAMTETGTRRGRTARPGLGG